MDLDKVDVIDLQRPENEIFHCVYRAQVPTDHPLAAAADLAPGSIIETVRLDGRVPWANYHARPSLRNKLCDPSQIPADMHASSKAEELFSLRDGVFALPKLKFAIDDKEDVPMDNLFGIVTKVWRSTETMQITRIELAVACMKDNGFCKRPCRTIRCCPSGHDLRQLQWFSPS